MNGQKDPTFLREDIDEEQIKKRQRKELQILNTKPAMEALS